MKWYQVLECDNTKVNPLICDYDNLEEYGFSEFDFISGKKINNWKKKVFVKASNQEDDGDPDDALQSHLGIPIFSSSLIEKLGEAKISGIQYLPINVIRPNNELIHGYCIANLINYISAFCYEKSEYNLFKDDFPNPNVRGKLMNVIRFVLYGHKLNGIDIIRLKEYQQRFFISERFKIIFEKNKFTGYSFLEIGLV